MSLPRRNFLRGMGVAPLAARIAGGDMAARLSGIELGSVGGLGVGETPSVQAAPKKIFDFASWLSPERVSDLWKDAKRVRNMDPDIASMSLPLTTLTRLQVKRNFERELEDRKSWFEKRIKREGFVNVWDD